MANPVVQVQIAHIRALKPDGPRYNKLMSPEERNGFRNLVLLCEAHHKRADRAPDRYTPEKLHEMKRSAEGDHERSLEGLSGLTQEDFEELVVQSFEKTIEHLDSAVDRLEAIDREAAELLRPLITELEVLRESRVGISEDAIGLLAESTRKLEGLDDTAALLDKAADRLQEDWHLRSQFL